MNIVEKSDILRQQANSIIEQVGAKQLFSTLGDVEIVGSVRLNTMFRRDIDLLVFSEDINRGLVEEVNNRLVASKQFRSVGLADYQTTPGDDMPDGYYWELIFEDEAGEIWKFDVWYLRPSEKYSNMVMSAIHKFEPIIVSSPEKRKLILEIKEKYFDGTKYRDGVNGIDVYTAVLESGINSIEEFQPQS